MVLNACGLELATNCIVDRVFCFNERRDKLFEYLSRGAKFHTKSKDHIENVLGLRCLDQKPIDELYQSTRSCVMTISFFCNKNELLAQLEARSSWYDDIERFARKKDRGLDLIYKV